jgi:hypothetical protein
MFCSAILLWHLCHLVLAEPDATVLEFKNFIDVMSIIDNMPPVFVVFWVVGLLSHSALCSSHSGASNGINAPQSWQVSGTMANWTAYSLHTGRVLMP